MSEFLRALAQDDSGVAGVEYAFLIALIALALISELVSIGNEVAEMYGDTHVEYLKANSRP